MLLQLPPDLRAAPELLRECLQQFPSSVRVAVEPRHESWWSDEVRGLLAAANAALCWADRSGSAVTPLWRTAGWGYLRLHEGDGAPWPSYREATLGTWAERITATWAGDGDVFVYFNNDQNCAAPRDAARLAAAVARRGGQAARAWPDGTRERERRSHEPKGAPPPGLRSEATRERRAGRAAPGWRAGKQGG